MAFEGAHEKYGYTSDYSLILSILKNNPYIVPEDISEYVVELFAAANSDSAKRAAIKDKEKRNPLAATTNGIQPVLDKYYQEKMQGIHQYNNGEVYNLDLVQDWITKTGKSTEVLFILGHTDYLRLIGRSIEKIPNKLFQKRSGLFYMPSLIESMGRQSKHTKKELSKFFKRLSRQSYLTN